MPRAAFLNTWCLVPGFRAEFMIRILAHSCGLEHILEHDAARASFERFVRSEHAEENLVFFMQSSNWYDGDI